MNKLYKHLNELDVKGWYTSEGELLNRIGRVIGGSTRWSELTSGCGTMRESILLWAENVMPHELESEFNPHEIMDLMNAADE